MKRLGICIAGFNGAVASTMVAGVSLIRRGLASPSAVISEDISRQLGLAGCETFVFGGWDPRGENVLESVARNRVIAPATLLPAAKELGALRPFRNGAKSATGFAKDIERFRKKEKLELVVVLNLLPTGMDSESRAYAAAADATGSPFINFTPNDCHERNLKHIPFCGSDGKTGQTWLKSVLAPAFRARGLRVTGWYSTNLLGNEDGVVVGDPKRGVSKIRTKSKLLSEMLGYEPHHQVQINFYPPRGDNKESWDNIDFEGFLGLPMQIKVNALWRDSILAAPMCIDLVRFMELANRRGERGPQEWLSFFFKSPYSAGRKSAPHEAYAQEQLLRGYLKKAGM